MTSVVGLWFFVVLNGDHADHLLAGQHWHCQPALSVAPAGDEAEALQSRFQVASYEQWFACVANVFSQTLTELACG